jgi:hypothetical protein
MHSLTDCVGLEHLDCSECTLMHKLPLLPVSLVHLNCSGCVNLTEPTCKQHVPNLKYLDCRGCSQYVLDGLVFPTDFTTTVIRDAGNRLYLPLDFWFNRNPGLAIPLVAFGDGSGATGLRTRRRRRRGGRISRQRKKEKEEEKTNRHFLDILVAMSCTNEIEENLYIYG